MGMWGRIVGTGISMIIVMLGAGQFRPNFKLDNEMGNFAKTIKIIIFTGIRSVLVSLRSTFAQVGRSSQTPIRSQPLCKIVKKGKYIP